MPLIEVPIPHLLGGVSQQPAAGRQPGQLEACDNALLHVVNGLAKRHGTRHIAKLVDGRESVVATHLINRDPAEQYMVLLGERRVRVFDANDGTEYPVRVNGSATAAGRGETTSGTPINYLDPRVAGGELDQDEDFVIGAGDWLSDAANSVTSYVTGRGPFGFGRRQSLTAVTADTVAEVGNGAAATVSDIHQTVGTFARGNLLSVFVKKSSSAINDIELTLHLPGAPDTVAGARFDIDTDGVVTFGALVSASSSPEDQVQAEVEAFPDGWYRCSVRVRGVSGLPATGEIGIGGVREAWIRFHTNAATPANKRALLFGGRLYDNVLASDPVPDYIHDRPDLFRALTVADTTFLLNTETEVAMDTTEGVVNDPMRVFVFVRSAGQADVNYTVKVKYLNPGITTATFTFTTGAGPGGLQTDDDVAEGLRALIDANAFLVATRVGNVIRIVTEGGATRVHGVEVYDSRGDTLMVAITLSDSAGFFQPVITKFTDLPLIMDDDFVVAVVGDPERDADDYYVKFDGDEESTNLVHGHWEESTRAGQGADAGMLIDFDASTLPLQLTRLQDNAAGTKTGVPFAIYFDVSEVDWDSRLVGDENSNPEPSFVGATIRDIFLYRGRLGFLSEDNVILSEAGEVFNFWRSTVLDLVDTDPIDVNAGVRDVVLFRNAAPTADSLVLLSDRHVFQLLGDPTLTPATAQLSAVRAVPSLVQARPVDTGRGIVFARGDGAFSGLTEASLLRDDVSFNFDDVTVQAPRLIVGNAVELAHSALASLTLARADEESTLYVHQTFQDDQQNRLQSALHRWTLGGGAAVRGMGFVGSDARLVLEREEGWFLEALRAGPEVREDDGALVVHLDRRLSESQVSATYDGPNDETTFVLPYEIPEGVVMQVVDRASGLLVPVLEQNLSDLLVSGDMSESAVYIGEAYEMRATLTEPVLQEQSPRGGIVPRMGRPLDMYRLYLYLAETALVSVVVEPDLRSSSEEEFAAAGLGTGLLLEGELSTYTGDAQFSIIALSTEADVSITNDTPFPSRVQSGRWEILSRPRAATA